MNYKQKIIINIILIPILASVLFTIEPIKVYWTDNIIKNVIFSNDLGKGEIVFRVDSDRITYTNDHLSHVIMKYEDEYVYFQSKTFNDFHKGDQGGTHINKVDFYLYERDSIMNCA